MLTRYPVSLLAVALVLVACASRQPPWCPYKGLAAGECPSQAARPLDAHSSLRGLSEGGKTALRTLRAAPRFTTVSVARSLWTAPEVEAWRVLLREEEGEAAFRCLATCTRPPSPGKLFGLCGLWFVDRAAFEAEVAAVRADYPDATVPTLFWCFEDDSTPLEEVLPEIVNGSFPRSYRDAE